MSLGERFRAAREERGLSLSEVADQIRIRSVYLSAIEEEQWSAIGAPVYIRGFLRTYARFLGLDAEAAVAEFSRSVPEPPARPQEQSRSIGVPGRERSLAPLLWAAGLVAAGLVAFVVYLYLSPPHRRTGVASATAGAVASPAASPAASASASAVPSGSPAPSASPASLAPRSKQALTMTLTAPSWLRVTVDGNVRIEGTFPAGTTKTVHGKQADVRIGNAGGVRVAVDGKDIGTLGGPGDVVEKTFDL